jgi:hypothetical protein
MLLPRQMESSSIRGHQPLQIQLPNIGFLTFLGAHGVVTVVIVLLVVSKVSVTNCKASLFIMSN